MRFLSLSMQAQSPTYLVSGVLRGAVRLLPPAWAAAPEPCAGTLTPEPAPRAAGVPGRADLCRQENPSARRAPRFQTGLLLIR